MGFESQFHSLESGDRRGVPDIENFETRASRKLEGGKFEGAPKDKRFSQEEALVYQDYATKKEGAAFSEKAGESSYEEAEKLIEYLRSKNFDWIGIDWDKVDFRNAQERATVEKRLDAALRELIGIEDPDGKSGISSYLRSMKGVILPFVLAASLIAGKTAESAWPSIPANMRSKTTEKAQTLKSGGSETNPLRDANIEFKHDTRAGRVSPETPESYRFYSMIMEWKSAHPEVKNITIDSVTSQSVPGRSYKGLGGMEITHENLFGKAEIRIETMNGKTLECRGQSLKTFAPYGSITGIDEVFEFMERGIDKITGTKPEFHTYASNTFARLRVEKEAIQDALRQCESMLLAQ